MCGELKVATQKVRTQVRGGGSNEKLTSIVLVTPFFC